MGIRKKEKNSLIRLLIKAILPSSAPPRRLVVTPARLYQPIPLATAAPSAGEIPRITAQISPPMTEPTVMPRGIIRIFR